MHKALNNITQSLSNYIEETLANENNTQNTLRGMNDTLENIRNELEVMFNLQQNTAPIQQAINNEGIPANPPYQQPTHNYTYPPTGEGPISYIPNSHNKKMH